MTERILLGPGPSVISPRVMRSMATPVLSHLDPELVVLMDDVRARLARLFQAPAGSLTIATSGTGTSGTEALVGNLVTQGTRVLVIVSGYFGERLFEICRRHGADVTRLEVEWGRAVDPQAVKAALASGTRVDIVACVHGETSTGALNPIRDVAAIAHDHGAMVLIDAVTTLGGHPLDMAGWGLDAVHSCSQKCIGAPSGMAPIAWSPAAQRRKVASRSFYLDLGLLEDYWVGRKFHHTLSSTMIYALREALLDIDEEGLEARWSRHERNYRALGRGLDVLGLDLVPPPAERLWTLNAIRVPAGIDEAVVRTRLRDEFSIEIGAGLGVLAGKIWRVGLMGAGSTSALLLKFLDVFERVLQSEGHRSPGGASAAAQEMLRGLTPPGVGVGSRNG